MAQKIIGFLLRFSLGAVFIFSGIIKLYPIEPFELTFVDVGIANWTIAPYFARLIIALEVFLGLMLIFNVKLKAFTVKATAALLIFFTGYLLYAILTKGNKGNCGCFGTFLEMTPLQSIFKNLAMLLILLIIQLTQNGFQWKIKWLWPVLLVVSIATPFILYPLDWVYYEAVDTGFVGKKLPLEKLPELELDNQKVDLAKGKYILAFFSLSCPHCKIASQKLAIITRQVKTPPVYVVFYGNEKLIEKFFEISNARFPYILFNEDDYVKMSGPALPSIYYVNNSVVLKRWGNLELEPAEFENLP